MEHDICKQNESRLQGRHKSGMDQDAFEKNGPCARERMPDASRGGEGRERRGAERGGGG